MEAVVLHKSLPNIIADLHT